MNKKLIIALIILTVLGVGIFYFLTTANVGSKYNTVEVEKRDLEKYVNEVGTISSKNIRSYYGNSLSKVEKMDLEVGDYVKKGQLLIKFEENIDLEIQRVGKQVAALRASYNEALSGTDLESVSTAKINIASIKSTIDRENENLKNIEELFEIEAIAENDLKQAKYSLEQLENNLTIAENNYNQLVKGLSKNMKAKYQAEIDALGISLKILEGNRGNYMICADFDGIITEINTFVGDTPPGGKKILEIMDPLERIIVVNFFAEDALIIRPDMKAEVNDDKLGIQIDNIKVQKIYPKLFTSYSQLGVEENRQSVEINLPQANAELPFGLKVDTKVMIEGSRKVLFIPEGAVYEKDLKKYVEVLEDEKAIEREVIIGIKKDNFLEIKEGLKEGDKVILHYKEK